MNGAETMILASAAAGMEVCFANPGTSEMAMVDALRRERRCRFCHSGLVNVVGAWPRQAHFGEWQAERGGLGVKQRLADVVHGDAAGLLLHRGDQAGDFDLFCPACLVQRPGGILAGTPGNIGFWHRGEGS